MVLQRTNACPAGINRIEIVRICHGAAAGRPVRRLSACNATGRVPGASSLHPPRVRAPRPEVLMISVARRLYLALFAFAVASSTTAGTAQARQLPDYDAVANA